MIVVIPIEPTLVVITSGSRVPSYPTNAASGPSLAQNARHCAAPEIFLHQ